MAELLIWLGAASVAALSLLGLVDSFCYLWETRERPDESEAVIAQGFEEAARNFRDCISLLDAVPTLTPPNEWVSRLRELDELYTKLHAVTGFTVEQLLEMFAAGYTLEKHDYSKSFEEMASLLEYEKEHANAYYEEC